MNQFISKKWNCSNGKISTHIQEALTIPISFKSTKPKPKKLSNKFTCFVSRLFSCEVLANCLVRFMFSVDIVENFSLREQHSWCLVCISWFNCKFFSLSLILFSCKKKKNVLLTKSTGHPERGKRNFSRQKLKQISTSHSYWYHVMWKLNMKKKKCKAIEFQTEMSKCDV